MLYIIGGVLLGAIALLVFRRKKFKVESGGFLLSGERSDDYRSQRW